MENPNVDPLLLSKIIKKQKERQESFAKLKSTHPYNETATNIVQLPVEELLTKLKCKELSATTVLRAYTAKALEVTEKFNCVTEFIPRALEWASALDAISPESNITGPLHGLPVAIKDDHDVEGMDSTLGFAKNLYKPVTESAVLVKILLKLGAVPFLKTNIPQSLFSNGSDNPIFGTTLNCHNLNLAPAGSSSGSACIVAAGGAPFATGSDLGGSLRTPSAFHGICSLKGTLNRLSDKGIVQCIPKLVGHRGVPGIIAADAKTLALVWKAITGDNIQNEFDPFALPIPWNENLFSQEKKFTIGYFTSLPFFPTFEDTRKTVLAAKAAFESKGHNLVNFEMPNEFHYMGLMMDLLQADHGRHLGQVFAGEPVSYCVAEMAASLKNSQCCTTTIGDSIRAQIVSRCGANVKTASDLWDVVHEKRVITRNTLDKMEKAGIDLILSPAFPYPAIKLHAAYGLSGAVYTMIWNFVDFPAGVVRFGKESGLNVESYDDQNDPMLIHAKNAMQESAGMPINVQISAKPFKEELVLKAMMELEGLYST